MASVQFYGAEKIIEAAANRKCCRWAIFCGSQFLFKYEGESDQESQDFLSQVLESIEHSSAVYTIKFYEDAVKIKDKTPHDGSFNFRLIGEDERMQKQAVYQTGSRAVIDKLEAIEARLNAIDEAEEEEPAGISGVLMGLLQEPEKLGALINIGKSLLGMGPTYTQQPVRVAGTPGGEDEKLSKAIETLKRNDPKIADHLGKLADISETDKATFKYLLSMLDKM